MRNSVSGKGRHVTDAFRTVFWFHELRLASGATSTYQMDGLLEVTLTLSADTRVDRKSAWRGYQKGRHTPSAELVTTIDALHPGTQALLNHPVWQLLRLDRALSDQIPDLLGWLPPALHRLVWDPSAPRQRPSMRKDWSGPRLRRLQRHIGLDSLACLVALLRQSADAGGGIQAFHLSRALCQTLLILGPWICSHGIAQALADYVEKFLLPLATHRGWQHSFAGGGFLYASRRLDEFTMRIECEQDLEPTHRQKIDLRLDLLKHRYYKVDPSMFIESVGSATSTPDPTFDDRAIARIFDRTGR